MIFSLFAGGCGNENASPDFAFIDNYLQKWDRFARGAKELVAEINRDTRRFQRELARAILQGDRRAPSRLVFYAVVQVGGFIPCDSELGRACEGLVGAEVAILTSKKNQRFYFAGDLYFWWERHQMEFERFALYDEWQKQDFAKKTVIPAYVSASKRR